MAEFEAHKKRRIRRCETRRTEPAETKCKARLRPKAGIHVRNATIVIHALLNAGADPRKRTNSGKTPFELIKDGSPLYGTEAYRRLKDAYFRGSR